MSKKSYTINESLFSVTVLLMLALSSCDVQKRHYRSGFYFSALNSPVNNANADLHLKSENGTSRENKKLLNYSKKETSSKFHSSLELKKNSLSNKHLKKNNIRGYSSPAIKKIPTYALEKNKIIFQNNKASELDFGKERRIKNMSIASLASAVASYSMFFVSLFSHFSLSLSIFFAILAIVFGAIARKNKKSYAFPVTGSFMATLGIVLGIVYLAIATVLFFTIFALFF